MAEAQSTGAKGEAIACAYLEQRGYRLIQKNYRFHRYEIDLIMMDGDRLVFVEVKSHRNRGFGLGREAVNAEKQRRISLAAAAYLQQHGCQDQRTRFDVIEIDPDTAGVTHIKDAFLAR